MRNAYIKANPAIVNNKERIKLSILTPLLTAILALLATFTIAVYRLQQENINNDLLKRIEDTTKLFQGELDKEAQLLGTAIHFLKSDPKLQQIWLAKNHDMLLDYTTPIFKELRTDYQITHFYFIDVNQICFLRCHNPDTFGDYIDRFTLLEAARSQKSFWGIELGKYGTFTLRKVHPWFINNTLAGYIELGKEIEHITPRLKEILGIDLALLIDKSKLNRENWQEGLKVMGRTGNWDLMPNHVIIDSTIPVIPPKFIELAGSSHDLHENCLVSTTFTGSTYRAGCVPLTDATGHMVGKILIIKNISKELVSIRTFLAVIATICFFIGALLASLFYIHITRIEKRLIDARSSLETEIEKRKGIESELRRHRDNLEKTVKDRTAELEQTNNSLKEEIAERKKAENSLRKSEQRFKQVVENAGDWIWEVDAEGLYTYSSPVVEKILGYKPHEIVGSKHFYDFFAPSTKEELKKSAMAAFSRKESFRGFVNPVIHKNGNTVILETTGTPILDDNGNLLGYRGTDRDITDRKRAEDRLLAVSELQKLLLPPAPIEQKLKFVTDSLVRTLDADFARIWTIKPGDRCEAGCTHAEVKEGPHVCRYRDKCLHLIASSGRYTHLDGKDHRRVPFGCYKIGLIAAGKQDKFLTNEAATDPQVHNHAWAKELGLVSFAGYRLTHNDGTPLGVMAIFSKHPVSPEENALLGAIAHLTSMVLHASQAEETIREKSELYHALFEQATDAIFLMDNEYFIDCNKRTLEMFGVTREQIINQLPVRFSPEFQADGRRSAEKAMEKIHAAYAGQPQSFEWIHTRSDGTPFDAEVSLSLIKIGGRPLLHAIVRNITDRKKAKEALRKNEEFTRSVIESSSDCIKVLDLEGHLLSMSGGGQKLLEIDDMACYLNNSFIDFWKGKEREDCLEAISKAKLGDTGIFYGNFATAKGTPKSWEVIVTPIKDADGSINRLLAVSRDITARKKAEESIENLNRDLRSTVALLTRSNKQLREFSFITAHDLKTPLRGISTLAQWLSKDYYEKFDEHGREQINLLLKRVQRMDNLIDSVLQYSTITRKKNNERPVDLNLLLNVIINEIHPPQNIKITFSKDLPIITCDERNIAQVFYNLILNAVKAMDKPQGHIIIDYVEEDDCWQFSVSDNGPGIEPKHFERIFQLFQTLDDRDQTENIGAGLTIARKIVELYGGKIWLISEVGRGSTFYFTLPKTPAAIINQIPQPVAT